MTYSPLEITGAVAICAGAYFVLRELWDFLYTCFIGHALGRSISLRDIGQWAGTFHYYYYYFYYYY